MKIKLKNININYEQIGKGYPLLCLHGYTLDHKVMLGCLEPIFKKKNVEWMRIYVDLPGMGKSETKNWVKTADDMLNILIQFINKVIPNQNFIIASESYGSYLARGLIKKMKERIDGLLMICPCVIPCANERDLPKYIAIKKDTNLLNKLTAEEREHFCNFTTIQIKKVWEKYQDDILTAEQIDDTFIEQYKNKGYSFSFDKDINDFFVKPTLILVGRQDSTVGYKDAYEILEYFPRASFMILDSAAHSLQIEQVDIFSIAVEEWLTRIKDNFKLQ